MLLIHDGQSNRKSKPTRGQHALFYSVQDDWRFIVHHTNLRKVVKRVKPDVVSQTDYQNLS
jgi:hypothetical protein